VESPRQGPIEAIDRERPAALLILVEGALGAQEDEEAWQETTNDDEPDAAI